jgi:hypothetical protein
MKHLLKATGCDAFGEKETIKWCNVGSVFGSGAPGETRTPDPLVRSQMLYPAELRARDIIIPVNLNFIRWNVIRRGLNHINTRSTWLRRRVAELYC